MMISTILILLVALSLVMAIGDATLDLVSQLVRISTKRRDHHD